MLIVKKSFVLFEKSGQTDRKLGLGLKMEEAWPHPQVFTDPELSQPNVSQRCPRMYLGRRVIHTRFYLFRTL